MSAWVAAARAQAHCPPRVPRLPLFVAGKAVGSVEDEVLNEISLQPLQDVRWTLSKQEYAWHLEGAGDATPALNALAHALRAAGRCGPWRDEQLAVRSTTGERVGTIERGAVRPLGIATLAVHLVGWTADGRMWVQQRAFDKANNPGQWDTLMGGMVSAADSLEQALARETWEEAGLHVQALRGVRHGGHVDFAQPSDEAHGCGYMVERIHWYSATVPDGVEPCNQDGEVERFECIARAELEARLAQGAFTPEAALILAMALGW
ncbi:MAG: NUDIX domain-containing protein [Acidovorax sp.]